MTARTGGDRVQVELPGEHGGSYAVQGRLLTDGNVIGGVTWYVVETDHGSRLVVAEGELQDPAAGDPGQR